MIDARRVGDHERRSAIRVRLGERPECLVSVRAHGDLRHVDVTVGEGHQAEVLLARSFASRVEPGDGRGRRRLRRLAARVRIHLGVDDENVDVLARRQDVIEPAVPDVVRPAVAADDPERPLHEEVAPLPDPVEQDVVPLPAFQKRRQHIGAGSRGGGLFPVFHPVDHRLLQVGVEILLKRVLHLKRQKLAVLPGAQEDPESVFAAILEERVPVCGTMPPLVRPVRDRREAAAPDRRASRRIDDDHPVAEQLREELDVRRLAAARARARELEQRPRELASLHRSGLFFRQGFVRDPFRCERPQRGAPLANGVERLHRQRRLRRGTDIDASAAPGAVQDRDRKVEVLPREPPRRGRPEPVRRAFGFALVDEQRADGGVRTDERTLVALDALRCVPDGDVRRNASFLPFGRSERHEPALVAPEDADGKTVALLRRDGKDDIPDKIRHVRVGTRRFVLRRLPFLLHRDAHEIPDAAVDRGEVHVDDLLSLLGIAFGGGLLQIRDGGLDRKDIRDLEKRRLHDHVDAPAEADFLRDPPRVDRVEFDFARGEGAFHRSRKAVFEFAIAPRAVEKELPLRAQPFKQVVRADVRLVVAGDEIGRVDVIRRLDRGMSETQMRYRDAAGFLRVVREVRLGVHIRSVADDLDRALVRPYGAVGAEAPEFARDRPLGRRIDGVRGRRKGRMRHVVDDADRERVLRPVRFQVLEHRNDHRGVEVLRPEPISAADDAGRRSAVVKGAPDLDIEGFSRGGVLFRPVEDGDFFDAFREGGAKPFGKERPKDADADQADLLAVRVHPVDRLPYRAARRPHRHDDPVRIRSAVIVEEPVLFPGDPVDFAHVPVDHRGKRLVVRVDGLPELKVDVRIDGRAAKVRVIRVQRVVPEGPDRVLVDERAEFVVFQHLDLLDFVGRPESVEEMEARDARADRRQVRNRREVHHVLDAVRGEDRKPRLACRHNVLMLAEDAPRVVRERSRAHVKDGRQQLSGDPVHVRDHEEEPLRRRVRRGVRAALERPVNDAGSPALGLHFHDLHGLSEEVLPPLRRPFVDEFRHRRRRRDREDPRNFRERVRNVRRGGISVHGFHSSFRHGFCPLLL